MTTFARFARGVVAGFVVAPFVGGASVVLCDSPSQPPRGLSSRLYDSLPQVVKGTASGRQPVVWGAQWSDDWDHPETRSITDPKAGSRSVQRQIVLIRHGQYANEGSHNDSIRLLTRLGEKQARATGVYLQQLFGESKKQMELHARLREAKKKLAEAKINGAGEGELMKLQELVTKADQAERSQGGLLVSDTPLHVYVSDMNRAKQTAQCILEAFPPGVRSRLTIDADLRERFPCDPLPGYEGHRSSEEDQRIAEEVFERYFYRPTTSESSVDVIVGHGNVIRYLTLRALQLPPEAWLRTSLPHCSVTILTINGRGRVKLAGFGSYGHLPASMATIHNIK